MTALQTENYEYFTNVRGTDDAMMRRCILCINKDMNHIKNHFNLKACRSKFLIFIFGQGDDTDRYYQEKFNRHSLGLPGYLFILQGCTPSRKIGLYPKLEL